MSVAARLGFVLALASCAASLGSACGGQTEPPAENPADYPYATLDEARSAISSFAGPGCQQMRSYVGCASHSQAECPPRYRLDPIAVGATLGPCGDSTFVGATVVAPDGGPFTWTCASVGTWTEPGGRKAKGALVCRP